MYIFWVFLLYSACFVFLLTTLIGQKLTKFYILAKTINSIAFVSIACFSAYISNNTWLLRFLLPAFICCLLGDIILGFFQQTKKTGLFLFWCNQLFPWASFLYPYLHIAAAFDPNRHFSPCPGRWMRVPVITAAQT